MNHSACSATGRWQAREVLSGFTGSMATLVVTPNPNSSGTLDISVAAASRGRVSIFYALSWGVLSYAIGVAEKAGYVTFGFTEAIWCALAFVVVMVLSVWYLARVERLNAAIRTVNDQPEIRKLLAQEGAEPGTFTPAEFATYYFEEIAKWKKLVAETLAKMQKAEAAGKCKDIRDGSYERPDPVAVAEYINLIDSSKGV